MEKNEELWDDSALLKAFTSALGKYKEMHADMDSTDVSSVVPENARNEHVEVDDNEDEDPALMTSERNGDNGNTSQVPENPNAASGSVSEHLVSSNIQSGGSSPRNNASVTSQSGLSQEETIQPGVQSQNVLACSAEQLEQYNLLLSKYYEIENQRETILQQLYSYNWNYQTHDSSALPSEEQHGSIPQPNNTVSCSCSYGCQNWVIPYTQIPDWFVPSNARPACFGPPNAMPVSGVTCTDTARGDTIGASVSEKDPYIVKTGMAAAQRALSSLRKEDIYSAGASADGGKGEEVGVKRGHIVTDSSNSTTDLAAVLNAWYTAGLYTGKYLSEQEHKKDQ